MVGFAAGAPRATAAYETTFFPLGVGDAWTYNQAGGAGRAQTPPETKIDARWFDARTGYVWYRIRNFNGDLHWIRQTSIGRIYEWGNKPWYRLGAGPGFPWIMDMGAGAIACSDGARLEVVSRSEQVTVAAGTFAALHIQWTTQCRDAGITDEWFVKGIGLVKRVEETIAGPRTTELQYAKIGRKQYGSKAQPGSPIAIAVSTDQPSYYENHMPGPGPRPTQGPTITVSATMTPTSGQDATVNTPDFNVWLVTIADASGNVVYSSPQMKARAPAGGVNHTVKAAGDVATFTVNLPYGTAQGTYTVTAHSFVVGAPQDVKATFDYGWAF
ncbi:MAG TPA: hypothetical protein VHF22_08165 [Planctomycetota bacterium]|nr:hypothetical protein [Planctomycetota bacterium]